MFAAKEHGKQGPEGAGPEPEKAKAPAPVVQRAGGGDAGGGGGGDDDPRAIASSLGPGRPLDGGTASRMGRAFGGERFDDVRVHDDGAGAQQAERLGAHAFTIGRDVAFGAGKYAPSTFMGDALLAHELAHVVQQRGAAAEGPQRKATAAPAGGALERDADRAAGGVMARLYGGARSAVGAVGQLASNVGVAMKSDLSLMRCRRPSTQSGPSDAGPQPTPGPAGAGPQPADAGSPDAGGAPEDQAILSAIRALETADLRRYLTGRLPSTSPIHGMIRARIQNRVDALNALGPPVPITIASQRRDADRNVGGGNTLGSGGSAQTRIVFNKFFLRGSVERGWDTFPAAYKKPDGSVDTRRWLRAPSATRLRYILEYSSLPGASRHHWGTDVDFNSTTVLDWEPGHSLAGLGAWLVANAPSVGFRQSFTTGRSGGYHAEAWHWSYAPLATAIRGMYNDPTRGVRKREDVVEPMMSDWGRQAAEAGVTLPGDLESALMAINLDDYVNNIGPGL